MLKLRDISLEMQWRRNGLTVGAQGAHGFALPSPERILAVLPPRLEAPVAGLALLGEAISESCDLSY